MVTEPTELDVAIAHKGFAGFEIETRGRAAHGSRPDLGEDAIVRMAPVLAAGRRFASTREKRRATGSSAASSLHASLIEGGRSSPAIPSGVC